MKQPYQIENQRAMQRFEAAMRNNPESVQLLLPSAEIVAAMKEGAGALMRQAGLLLMQLIMEQEVEQMAGARYQQTEPRQGYRWGKEKGWCRVDGQKVPIERKRVRNQERELPLGSYLLFQRDPQFDSRLWQQLMRGLSTRNYGRTVRRFSEAYGIEKSVVSEQFVDASRRKLRELLERRLEQVEPMAVFIDGTSIEGETLVIALGLGKDGKKTVLGLRQGGTENATVVGDLCDDLAERGLDFSKPRLYVLDGAKALNVAVRKRAGEAAHIQRCQLHKERNVLSYLPDEHQPFIQQKLKAAWAMAGHEQAWQALEKVRLELERINPSAARSLAEGLEETLTIHRLGVPEMLRKTLFSTNPIESAISIVEEKCRKVKRWQGGDMKLRWVASGLLFAEGQFRRVKGFREIPKLVTAIQCAKPAASKPSLAVAKKVG